MPTQGHERPLSGRSDVVGPGGRTPRLSVVVLTLDEEELVERCLTSASWADEVLVVDSGSRDRTREIARRLGATVVEQQWLGWTGQRVAAMSAAAHDWILFLDADEMVTAPLAASIRAVLASGPDPRDGYSVDRRTEFLGDLVANEQRRSKVHSFVRLFHRDHSGYDPAMVVHERIVVPGRTHLLEGVLIHWRTESLAEHTARATRYAGLEARLADEYLHQHASVRRTALFPLLRVLWSLVARHDLALGTRGVLHALHQTNGEWMRQLMLFEQQGAGGLAVGEVSHRVAQHNRLPASRRHGAARLVPRWVPVWLAVPRLLLLGLAGLRTDPDDVVPLLDAYDRWNTGWLRAGKAWEARHTRPRTHPSTRVLRHFG